MSAALRVVAHEATRTGAPAVLLGLLRYAHGRLGVPIDVRTRFGGPLADALIAAGDGTTSEPPAAVLANSSLAAPAILDVAVTTPAAVYVHEEGDALAGLPPEARTALSERADLVLTVSERSRQDLIGLGVAPERVKVLAPLIDIGPLPTAEEVEAARDELSNASVAPLVIACGEVTWRKGADLFVAAIGELRRHRPVEAAWIGRRFAAESALLDRDARALGIQDHLRWIGEVDRPLPYLAAADVLVMTSREDPRPMVPMEAALVGTPTAGLAVGGLVDLAEVGAASVAPYPDVVTLARRIEDLLDDAELRHTLATRCAALAADDQGVDVIGPQFVDHLRSLLASGHHQPRGTKG